MFTFEDFNRKVEEEVQRRMREQAPKDGDSMSPAYHDHGIEFDDCQEGKVFVMEKENAPGNNFARPPVGKTSDPSCESPQPQGENYVPRWSNRSIAPQQDPGDPQYEEGPQISFVHTNAESTRHLCSHELHEGPPVTQAEQSSVKEKVMSRMSEEGRVRERKRLNKSIKVAIENDGHKRDRLRFRLSEVGILTTKPTETRRYKIR